MIKFWKVEAPHKSCGWLFFRERSRGVARISSRGGGESVKIIIRSKIYNLGKKDR